VNLNHRLRRLERDLGRPGACPACRDRRGGTVLVGVEERPDGTFQDLDAYPATCARCGEIPERVIRLVELLAECPPGTASLSLSEGIPQVA